MRTARRSSWGRRAWAWWATWTAGCPLSTLTVGRRRAHLLLSLASSSGEHIHCLKKEVLFLNFQSGRRGARGLGESATHLYRSNNPWIFGWTHCGGRGGGIYTNRIHWTCLEKYNILNLFLIVLSRRYWTRSHRSMFISKSKIVMLHLVFLLYSLPELFLKGLRLFAAAEQALNAVEKTWKTGTIVISWKCGRKYRKLFVSQEPFDSSIPLMQPLVWGACAESGTSKRIQLQKDSQLVLNNYLGSLQILSYPFNLTKAPTLTHL